MKFSEKKTLFHKWYGTVDKIRIIEIYLAFLLTMNIFFVIQSSQITEFFKEQNERQANNNFPGFSSIIEDGIYTNIVTKEVTNIFDGGHYFHFPKPSVLLQQLIAQTTESDDIILGFFSSSATTAHAVIQLNAEDEGSRCFIMVQLPEVCDEKSEAFRAGYFNICEIGKERIRRIGGYLLLVTAFNSDTASFLEKIKETAALITQRPPRQLFSFAVMRQIIKYEVHKQYCVRNLSSVQFNIFFKLYICQ